MKVHDLRYMDEEMKLLKRKLNNEGSEFIVAFAQDRQSLTTGGFEQG